MRHMGKKMCLRSENTEFQSTRSDQCTSVNPNQTTEDSKLQKTLWKKEKMLETGIFSFSDSVYHTYALAVWKRQKFCRLMRVFTKCDFGISLYMIEPVFFITYNMVTNIYE